jgi:hypothetical protein
MKPPSDHDPHSLDPGIFVPTCPICTEPMARVYDRNERRLFGCETCQTDLIVPHAAWEIAREHRERKRSEKS